MGKRFYWGWSVVAGTFLILAINYGTRYSFGIFIKPMFNEYNWPASIISLGVSINLFTYAVAGIITGWLLDRISPRWIVLCASILMTIGLYLTTNVKSPIEFYIYYGFFCGLGGSGMGLVVSTATVGKWFHSQKGLAIGLATMGIGFGTLALSPLLAVITNNFDWRWGFRFLSILNIIIGITVSQLLLSRSNPEVHEKHLDHEIDGVTVDDGLPNTTKPDITLRDVMKDYNFWIVSSVYTMAMITVMMCFIHQIAYATSQGVGSIQAASSVGLIGIASIGGRFFFGWISDNKCTSKHSAILGCSTMIAGMLILMNARTVYTIYLYAIIFGLGYGNIAPLMPILLSDLFGRKILGSAYGILTFFVSGIGCGLGPFVGGLIFDCFGSYSVAWLINAIILFLCLILLFFLKIDKKNISCSQLQ